jgi:hypothetical protein
MDSRNTKFSIKIHFVKRKCTVIARWEKILKINLIMATLGLQGDYSEIFGIVGFGNFRLLKVKVKGQRSTV